MEDKEKNIGNSKVISVDFKSEPKVQEKKPANILHGQSNPILRRLFKLTHAGLVNNPNNYKSFSSFKPEDLR